MKKNNVLNALLIFFTVVVVIIVLTAGKTEYQPYIQAETSKKEAELLENERKLDAYVKKLEMYFADYQRVSAITELDMKKIRVMEAYLLQNGGSGGKLQGRANDFMNICKFSEINLDPLLLWSISLQETGFGHSKAINNLNNVGGIFAGKSLRKYRSVYRGIVDMALNLKYSGYYDKVNGLYENNTTFDTIKQLGNIYCPVGATNDPTGLNKHWVPNVKQHYNNLVEMYNNSI